MKKIEFSFNRNELINLIDVLDPDTIEFQHGKIILHNALHSQKAEVVAVTNVSPDSNEGAFLFGRTHLGALKVQGASFSKNQILQGFMSDRNVTVRGFLNSNFSPTLAAPPVNPYLKAGEKVTYTPDRGESAKGIIKEIIGIKAVVVFNCPDWSKYQDHEGEEVNTYCLSSGWQ